MKERESETPVTEALDYLRQQLPAMPLLTRAFCRGHIETIERELSALRQVIAQHDLCHNLHGKVDAEAFAEGCASEQRKLYGCAPDADRVAALRQQVETLSSQRDTYARAIEEAARRLGIYNGEVALDGPQRLLLLEDIETEVARARQQVETAQAERDELRQERFLARAEAHRAGYTHGPINEIVACLRDDVAAAQAERDKQAHLASYWANLAAATEAQNTDIGKDRDELIERCAKIAAANGQLRYDAEQLQARVEQNERALRELVTWWDALMDNSIVPAGLTTICEAARAALSQSTAKANHEG